MSRPAPLLLGLLLPATGLLTIVAILFFGNSLITWGLAVAQVQLSVTAMVFVRKWLTLRILALVACLLVWSAVFAQSDELSSAPIHAWLLLTVTLFTSAWCGILALAGWRLEVPQDRVDAVSCRRQFSLATLLLATTIACVYGGLWRGVGFSWQDYPALMLTLMCCVAGCTLLKVTARGTWPWLPLATVVAIVVTVVLMPYHSFLLNKEFLLLVLGVQILLLLAVLTVLRIAGIYLVNDAFTTPLDDRNVDTLKGRKFNSLAAANASRSSAAPRA